MGPVPIGFSMCQTQPAGQASHLEEKALGFRTPNPSFSSHFPHHSPSPKLSQHGERKAFVAVTVPQENLSGTVITVNKGKPATLSSPSTHPSFLGREGPWPCGSSQGNSPELPVLESATTSLDQSCPVTSMTRYSLLCSPHGADPFGAHRTATPPHVS